MRPAHKTLRQRPSAICRHSQRGHKSRFQQCRETFFGQRNAGTGEAYSLPSLWEWPKTHTGWMEKDDLGTNNGAKSSLDTQESHPSPKSFFGPRQLLFGSNPKNVMMLFAFAKFSRTIAYSFCFSIPRAIFL